MRSASTLVILPNLILLKGTVFRIETANDCSWEQRSRSVSYTLAVAAAGGLGCSALTYACLHEFQGKLKCPAENS